MAVEEKSGKILEFTDDNSGYVDDRENPGGPQIPFEHHGARPTFFIGEDVNYLLIKTPGTTKAVNLGKPN